MSLTPVYGPIDPDDTLCTLAHAVDSGLTFIDTANVYGNGLSELTIARLIATRRDEVQLASKFGIVPGGGIGARGIRDDRAYVLEQIDLSLIRLGTDHLDLYYQHRVDPDAPIEETVGALAELVHAGKIRQIGLSEPTGVELRRAVAVHPIAAVQSEWGIISRDVERHVIPTAIELGFVPYSPLGRQCLTGRFDRTALTESDARHKFPRFAADVLAANQPLLDEVLAVAREAEVSPAQVALAWIYDKGRTLGIPLSPIPGSRFIARVDENLAAAGIRLDVAHVKRLDALAERVISGRSFNPQWVSADRE